MKCGDRVANLGPESGHRRADASTGEDLGGRKRRNRSGADRGSSGRAENDRVDPTVAAATYLDSHSTVARFGMGAAEHREASRGSVTACRADSGGDPSTLGKHRLEQHRIDERSAVAIDTANRAGKPAQFPPGTPDEAFPTAVSPVERLATQRGMVLTRTGRPCRTNFGDMNFVYLVECVRTMARQETREPRRIS